MSRRHLDRQTLYRLAGDASVDPRTVAKVIAGKAMLPALRDAVLASAKRLNIDLDEPAAAPSTPASGGA